MKWSLSDDILLTDTYSLSTVEQSVINKNKVLDIFKEAKFSINEIAKKVGLSYSGVYRILRKEGVL